MLTWQCVMGIVAAASGGVCCDSVLSVPHEPECLPLPRLFSAELMPVALEAQAGIDSLGPGRITVLDTIEEVKTNLSTAEAAILQGEERQLKLVKDRTQRLMLECREAAARKVQRLTLQARTLQVTLALAPFDVIVIPIMRCQWAT